MFVLGILAGSIRETQLSCGGNFTEKHIFLFAYPIPSCLWYYDKAWWLKLYLFDKSNCKHIFEGENVTLKPEPPISYKSFVNSCFFPEQFPDDDFVSTHILAPFYSKEFNSATFVEID